MTGLLDVADELYALPLADFTPERDARAKAAKGTPLAAQVKALRKPSTAAWLVNLLVRREPEQVDQLLAVGAALREAQAAMSAGELRALTKQRRQVTAAVTQHVRRLAGDEGHRVTEAVADQVEDTLTAAMVDAECGRAVRSGLLVSGLRTTGIEPLPPEEVAAAVAVPDALGFAATPQAAPEPRRPDLHVVPDPDKQAKARAAAEKRLAAAVSAYDEAVEEHTAAVDEVGRLTARSLQLQAEIDELRRRLSELEDESEGLDEEIAEAEDVRDEAAAALRTATADRDSAQAAVDRL
jgi:DNA repair exonuclease SbcCD ATPase subunit